MMLPESEESVGDEHNPHSDITGQVRIGGAYGYGEAINTHQTSVVPVRVELKTWPRPFFSEQALIILR